MTDEEKRRRKLKRMIVEECAENDEIRNLTGLAEKMGVDYALLYQRIHRGTVPALMMNEILHALNASPETVERFIKI
jgi:hypothetical protein